MFAEVDASTLKTWLSDGLEIALIDVREPGQYGMGHPFFAVPLPYSRFEIGLAVLMPNPGVRMVLCDDGDQVAQRRQSAQPRSVTAKFPSSREA